MKNIAKTCIFYYTKSNNFDIQKGEIMTKEERIQIYNDATALWGLPAQFDQLIEEMAELIVAVNKYKRKHIIGHEYQDNPAIEENLIEELADVTNCIEQITIMIGAQQVQEVVNQKLNRLKDLIVKIKAKN